MKKPSLKQKKFVKKYIELNGDATKATLASYNTKDRQNASTIGYQNLQKPTIQIELKKQLDKAGITLEYLNDTSFGSIEQNLQGKPSQAVAADMIKFMYRLHGVVPASKSMNLNLSKKEIVHKDYDEIKESLKEISIIANKLLTDTP